MKPAVDDAFAAFDDKSDRKMRCVSIIGLSSLSAARMAAPSKEIGAHSYLEKGTELAEIRAAIHEAADR